MKKVILIVIHFVWLMLPAQENNNWKFGLQWGAQGNRSEFIKGTEVAHARFHQNKFGSGGIALQVRYDRNEHWMWMSGLGINSFGFEFALSENYSLLSEKKRFSTIRTEFTVLEVPIMVFYKFKPNCKNAKWLVGLGLIHHFLSNSTASARYEFANEGNTNLNYLTSESQIFGGHYAALRFAVGREKQFERGSILHICLVLNHGMREMARSRVNYTIDGTEYNHEFSNNGNFAGLRISYFFRKNW